MNNNAETRSSLIHKADIANILTGLGVNLAVIPIANGEYSAGWYEGYRAALRVVAMSFDLDLKTVKLIEVTRGEK